MLKQVMCGGVVFVGAFCFQISVAGELSANIGYNSEYIYRGIPQKTSSAFAGLDYEAGGFSAGTWAADVGEGIEIDYYGAYGIEVGQFSFSAGGTWYTYTGDFDDEYLELNLGASWSFLSFDVAIGEYDNFAAAALNYQFYSLTARHNGFHAKLGMFEDDFDGTYYEAGYASNLSVNDTDLFDYSIALIHSDSTLLGGESDTNLILSLSKTFSF